MGRLRRRGAMFLWAAGIMLCLACDDGESGSTVEVDASSDSGPTPPVDGAIPEADTATDPGDAAVEPIDAVVEPEDSTVELTDAAVEPEDGAIEPTDGAVEPEDGAPPAPDATTAPDVSSCVVDNCGVCDEDPDNDCVQDCAGEWGGAAAEDHCGVCDEDPTNDCAQDCAGAWGGAAVEDHCGVCDEDPDNDCVQDCAGVWGGAAVEDNCGVCDDDPDNDCPSDCLGNPNGPAYEDNCGVCDADPDNDCFQDCAGEWGGEAIIDRCTDCVQPGDECQVATIYIGGTGTDSGWWAPEATSWDRTAEILALMHHAHVTGEDDAKVFIDGVSLSCANTPTFCSLTCPRCFDTLLDEARDWLGDLLGQEGWAGRRVVVNLIGWSRGAVTALRLGAEVKATVGVERVNVIALDPVPGDMQLERYADELCLAPDRLVTLYAWDERSDHFGALIYDAPPAETSMRFAVRGSHETIVGNTQIDGHSYSGSAMPDDSAADAALFNSYTLTASVLHALFEGPQWGSVRFDQGFSGFSEATFLDSLAAVNAPALEPTYEGMRGYCYAPLCVPESCDEGRCGHQVHGCPQASIAQDIHAWSEATPAIPLLGSAELTGEAAWARLTELKER